ncbi:hypothetical protein [Microbacterium azadirachtae]|uniref:Uncharacterized protein n=1 Tax=Microbacterium azadirachtae TaxID=582680 RepID=A0A1I6GV14_9MICO|nr:hypothetical protein [Microbacterium azadirachtae]SFR45976.1 hypothetical protein SAMN04488591_1594 [Microbacterium azadirachtae]
MEDSTQSTHGVSRRTLVKGAAWSVPVVAAAIAVPAQAASLPQGVDVAVTGACAGNYDLSVLTNLVGAGLVGLVQNVVLNPLGLTPNPRRTFTITAQQGTIPAGTRFSLTYPALINLNLGVLNSILTAAALNVVSTGNTSAEFTTTAPIPQGGSISFNVAGAIPVADLGVASTVTLTLLDTDHPNPGPGGPNSASVSSLVAAAVSLQPIFNGSLAVQLCG